MTMLPLRLLQQPRLQAALERKRRALLTCSPNPFQSSPQFPNPSCMYLDELKMKSSKPPASSKSRITDSAASNPFSPTHPFHSCLTLSRRRCPRWRRCSARRLGRARARGRSCCVREARPRNHRVRKPVSHAPLPPAHRTSHSTRHKIHVIARCASAVVHVCIRAFQLRGESSQRHG